MCCRSHIAVLGGRSDNWLSAVDTHDRLDGGDFALGAPLAHVTALRGAGATGVGVGCEGRVEERENDGIEGSRAKEEGQ